MGLRVMCACTVSISYDSIEYVFMRVDVSVCVVCVSLSWVGIVYMSAWGICLCLCVMCGSVCGICMCVARVSVCEVYFCMCCLCVVYVSV